MILKATFKRTHSYISNSVKMALSNFSQEFDLQDLKSNEMKELTFDNNEKCLVIKKNEKVYALGHRCTHYGAPLVNGVLHGNTLRCPWHGACFNIQSGDIEEFPGLDALHSFKVEMLYGTKYRISKGIDKTSISRGIISDNVIVIIGGGPCSQECAEALRKEGYQGKIKLISKDKYVPYDRTKLSKAMDSNFDSIKLRDMDFFLKNNIELYLDTLVQTIDFYQNIIIMKNQKIKYDKLMLAVGTTPNRSQCKGSDLKNVFLLRTFSDAQNILSSITPGSRVVIVGNSFIGMEAASFLVKKVASVTVVSRSDLPFESKMGKELGHFVKEMHEEQGVKFYPNVTVAEFKGADGILSSVTLSDGHDIPCDVCLLGLGVRPNKDLYKDFSGIKLNPAGFIITDEYLQTGLPNVYAGGDVVAFPLLYKDCRDPVNIQHWQMSLKHGQVAALNLLDKKVALHTVPYFWTAQYGKSLRYVGHVETHDNTIIHGSTEKGKFVIYYMKDKLVAAVLTFMKDPVASIFAELMLSKNWIHERQLASLEPLFESDSYVKTLNNLLNQPLNLTTHF